MPSSSALPPPLNLGPFHVGEALALGVSRARLRRVDLDAPFRGVRMRRGAETSSALAFLPLLGPDQFFSHSTAASLWGLWLPRRLRGSTVLHVTAFRPTREPRMPGVIGHRAADGSVELSLVGGIPLSSPVDTWRQLSAELTLDELIAAGDSLVRRGHPLLRLEQLRDAVTRHAGARGMTLLRRAQAQVRADADSPRETRLRRLLVRSGLPEPVVNPIVSRPGEGTMFGDLTYLQWRVIVEYDGRHHRSDRQYAADVVRLERLAAEGWTVIRVLAEHFDDPHTIVTRVARALHARGWRPTRSKVQLLR